MTHTIRTATTEDADLARVARIVSEVSPEEQTSVAELRWADATYPGGTRFLADEQTGAVVGYASLIMVPGEARRKAWHDMTAVVRAWRGRGVATALKRATIRWAIDNGLEVLITGNDVDNAAMRAVNARLGYRPTPDLLTMRGPLFDGMMARS